jgi:hypothetical protein
MRRLLGSIILPVTPASIYFGLDGCGQNWGQVRLQVWFESLRVHIPVEVNSQGRDAHDWPVNSDELMAEPAVLSPQEDTARDTARLVRLLRLSQRSPRIR